MLNCGCKGFYRLLFTIFLSVLLIACGSGSTSGGDGETPSLSISNAAVTEGDSGIANLNFIVSLSAQASEDVTVDYATIDGTATAGSDYTTISGKLTISAGSTSGAVIVSITGDTDIENNETLTLTLSNPNGASLRTATAIGTITNDDAAASLPTMDITSANVSEGDSGTSNLSFTVSLSTEASSDVMVDYATSDGTATAAIDYTAMNDTLTISAGSISGVVTVSITGDTDVENDETFTIALSNPSGASLGTALATGTITNDDTVISLPTVSIATTSVIEGDSGTSSLSFTISLNVQASSDVTVNYVTSDGTATLGSDYTAINGTATIPAGSTSGTVMVSIIGDTDVESNETLTVTLSNPNGASLGTATAIGTINDDDSTTLPTVSLTGGRVVEGDSGTSNLIFTVNLSTQASSDVRVDYVTSDGTATLGSDYTEISGTLTIPAGRTSAMVMVSIIGDTDVENDETLTLTLSNPNGASLGTATAIGTVNDDDSAATLLPTVNMSDVSVTEGDSGMSTLIFTISLSVQSSSEVTVDYATSDGTAVAGTDYTAINGTLTIPVGSTSGTVAVSVIGDVDVEGNETLTLTLSNANGVIFGTAIATGIINDDDDATTPLPNEPVSGLFYNSGSISMIDLANPSVAPIMVEARSTVGEAGLWHGAIDVAGQRATDLHTRTIIYGTADGIYKISALKGDPKTPVQVSNEMGVAEMCKYQWASDFADHNDTIYLYKMPGADTSCGTSDDEWKMVRVGMDATMDPVIAKEMDLEIYDTASGAIIGFLAFEGNKIIRCDQNFLSCSDVVSFVSNGEVLEDNPFIGTAILWVDDKLYRYNIATSTLSEALHTFSGGIPPRSVTSDTDGTNLYFADGNELYQLPLDGSATASLLTTAIAVGEINEINMTTNRVVYVVSALVSSMAALESVSKTGGAAMTLSSIEGFVSVQTAGRFVYYNRFLPTATGPVFSIINEDGTGVVETQEAQMTGFLYSSTQGVGEFTYGRIIWTEGCSMTDCRGGTIKSIDAATKSEEIVLGTIPQDMTSIVFVGMNNETLGLGFDGVRGSDIFFVNANLANSLKRITTTPAINEALLGGG